MPTPGTALAFFTASVLLALAPGPDNLFVLAQSALYGRRAGFMVTLGLCTGLVGHTGAVALGVAVIVQTSAAAFTALKVAGAGYLAWLAWRAFRASAESLDKSPGPPLGAGRLYARGIIMNLTNPKVSIFFLAFLPSFADPGRGPVAPQVLLLGILFILATLLVFGSVAVAAGTLGPWFGRTPRARRMMNLGAGIVLAGLALALAAASR